MIATVGSFVAIIHLIVAYFTSDDKQSSKVRLPYCQLYGISNDCPHPLNSRKGVGDMNSTEATVLVVFSLLVLSWALPKATSLYRAQKNDRATHEREAVVVMGWGVVKSRRTTPVE